VNCASNAMNGTTERNIALEQLERIQPVYETLLTIYQEELGQLEMLITNADWEHATQQIAHIRQRYHAAIAMHTLQNPSTT
jgi:hypothetical protein